MQNNHTFVICAYGDSKYLEEKCVVKFIFDEKINKMFNSQELDQLKTALSEITSINSKRIEIMYWKYDDKLRDFEKKTSKTERYQEALSFINDESHSLTNLIKEIEKKDKNK